MKVTYWKASCYNDSDVYSIRARTRKEVKAEIQARLEAGGRHSDYGTPEKIIIEYRDAFDLVFILRSEDACSY